MRGGGDFSVPSNPCVDRPTSEQGLCGHRAAQIGATSRQPFWWVAVLCPGSPHSPRNRPGARAGLQRLWDPCGLITGANGAWRDPGRDQCFISGVGRQRQLEVRGDALHALQWRCRLKLPDPLARDSLRTRVCAARVHRDDALSAPHFSAPADGGGLGQSARTPHRIPESRAAVRDGGDTRPVGPKRAGRIAPPPRRVFVERVRSVPRVGAGEWLGVAPSLGRAILPQHRADTPPGCPPERVRDDGWQWLGQSLRTQEACRMPSRD